MPLNRGIEKLNKSVFFGFGALPNQGGGHPHGWFMITESIAMKANATKNIENVIDLLQNKGSSGLNNNLDNIGMSSGAQ